MLEEGALKVTTALYYGPDGKTIQARGVSPDIRLNTKNKGKIQKESDLPRAIAPIGEDADLNQLNISESECREEGEKKDRALGCAFAFLEVGRVKFLADHSNSEKM